MTGQLSKSSGAEKTISSITATRSANNFLELTEANNTLEVSEINQFLRAAEFGNLKVINRSICSNKREIFLSAENIYEENAFMIAAKNNHLEILESLYSIDPQIIYGVNIFGFNSFMLAAIEGNIECMKIILEMDEELINSKDENNINVLHLAVFNEKIEVINELMKINPDLIYQIDNNGNTALDVALMLNKVEVINKLLGNNESSKINNFLKDVGLQLSLYSPLLAMPFAYFPTTFNNIALVSLSVLSLAVNSILSINLLKNYFPSLKNGINEVDMEYYEKFYNPFQILINYSDEYEAGDKNISWAENDSDEMLTPRNNEAGNESISFEKNTSRRFSIVSAEDIRKILGKKSSFSERIISERMQQTNDLNNTESTESFKIKNFSELSISKNLRRNSLSFSEGVIDSTMGAPLVLYGK